MKARPFATNALIFTLALLPIATLAKTSDFSKPPFPVQIEPPDEKFIVVSPRKHAWGAYDADGTLLAYGLASAGADYCTDIKKPCRTKTGTYRIYAMGDKSCYSARFPLPNGGAPMPYCMYFNRNQALHGSPQGSVVRGNVSHGCVRMHVADAKWLRYQFVEGPKESNEHQGTKVIILSY